MKEIIRCFDSVFSNQGVEISYISKQQWEKIRATLVEDQKPPTNSDAISVLRDLVEMIDCFISFTADAQLSDIGKSKMDRAKEVLKQHQ